MQVSALDGSPFFFERYQLDNKPPGDSKIINSVLNNEFYKILRIAETDSNRNLPNRPKSSIVQSNSLWVDKWAPEKFTDLVCIDDVNVRALKWSSDWKMFIEGQGPRPSESILLIGGPSGAGKSSLARVIAKGFSWNMIEINASDERSGSGVVDKIKNCVGSKGIKNNQISLLVIDEIDGAFQSSYSAASFKYGNCSIVSQLLKMHQKIARPIICLCNDLWIKGLAPLRQIALTMTMERPSIDLLASKLKEILQSEGIKSEYRALKMLAEAFNGDVRASINALQYNVLKNRFISAKNIELSSNDAESCNSEMDIWKSIFYRKSTLPQLRLRIQSNGQYERLCEGTHEIYLCRPFHDDTRLSKINRASDWFCWENAPTQYEPFKLQMFSLMFSTARPCKFKWPRELIDHRQNLNFCKQRHEEIIRSIPITQRYIPSFTLASEIYPLLLDIIDFSKKIDPDLLSFVEHFGIGFEETDDGWIFKPEPVSQRPIKNNSLRARIATAIIEKRLKSKPSSTMSPINDNANLEAKNTNRSCTVKRDFFGRPITTVESSSSSSKRLKIDQKKKYFVWYRHNEGHSNAVRRDIKIKDLFL